MHSVQNDWHSPTCELTRAQCVSRLNPSAVARLAVVHQGSRRAQTEVHPIQTQVRSVLTWFAFQRLLNSSCLWSLHSFVVQVHHLISFATAHNALCPLSPSEHIRNKHWLTFSLRSWAVLCLSFKWLRRSILLYTHLSSFDFARVFIRLPVDSTDWAWIWWTSS